MKMNDQREATRNYLQQIGLHDCRIERVRKQLEELEIVAERLGPERYQKYKETFQDTLKNVSAQRDNIIQQIVTLPDKYANILLMIHVKGLKIVEVSELTDKPERSISRTYAEALDVFRNKWERWIPSGSQEE